MSLSASNPLLAAGLVCAFPLILTRRGLLAVQFGCAFAPSFPPFFHLQSLTDLRYRRECAFHNLLRGLHEAETGNTRDGLGVRISE